MNPLDRKIAELKGYEIVSASEYEKMSGRETIYPEMVIRMVAPRAYVLASEQGDEGWSTSDAKALELVDELRGKWSFEMKSSPSGLTWSARFAQVKTGFPEAVTGSFMAFECQDISRPEAICRAYIAAREWMAGRVTP